MFPVGEKIPIAVVCYGFGKGLFQNYCQWCVWKGIFSFPVVVDQGLYYVQETGRCRCMLFKKSYYATARDELEKNKDSMNELEGIGKNL